MLERVKLALRLKTNAFDAEIQDIIAAGVDDLGIAGVDAPGAIPAPDSETSAKPAADAPDAAIAAQAPEIRPLIIRALILYAKAEFGNNPDAQKYRDAYMDLKTYLSIAMMGGEGV